MKYLAIFFLQSLFLFNSIAQQDQEFSIESINLTLLAAMVKEKVDSVRKSNSLNKLADDSILDLAAQNHSTYLAQYNVLSHFQEKKKKTYSPTDRILNFGGNMFIARGENAFSTPVLTRVSTTYSNEILTLNNYQVLANYIVRSWIASKPHYKGMLREAFTHTSVSISFNKDKSALYVVQVFGGIE